MIAQILGNYFVEKKLLTKGQVQNTLKKQSGLKVRLGTIAISEGLMTLAQAEAVNMLQQSIDKPFGDIAVQKGYLTDVQVSSLLREQGSEYILFMQTLNDDGLMDVPAFEEAVKQFKIDTGATRTTLEAMKAGSIDAIIETYTGDTMGDLTRHAGTGIRLFTRIVDKDAYIGKASKSNDISALNQGVFQKLIRPDGTSYYTGIVEKDHGLYAVAKGFAKEQFEDDELFIMDATGEFLNCVNGLYCTTMSAENVVLEIEPQIFLSSENIPSVISGTEILHVPVFIGDDSAELVFIL